MKYRTARVLAIAAPILLVLCSTLGVTNATASKSASPKYLLALGDSLAAGYQRSFGLELPPVDRKTGFRDLGYPGSYAEDVARATGMQLIDLGCPGETSRSFSTTPPRSQCAILYAGEFGASSQLGAAQSFLARERGQVGVVTFDLGANDVDPCIVDGAVNYRCLGSNVSSALTAISAIMSTLRSELSEDDPSARIVALNYYDPFLARAYSPGGNRGREQAGETLVAVNLFDTELGAVFRAAHVTEANVSSAFQIDKLLPLAQYRGQHLAFNVAKTCELTAMCPPAGQPPDIHPNNAGYSVIAHAIEKALAGRIA